MKQNQTFFLETCSSRRHIFFLLKYIKIFQCLLKSKFPSSMTKVNSKNGNKTKSGIFPWDMFKSDIVFRFQSDIILSHYKINLIISGQKCKYLKNKVSF